MNLAPGEALVLHISCLASLASLAYHLPHPYHPLAYLEQMDRMVDLGTVNLTEDIAINHS